MLGDDKENFEPFSPAQVGVKRVETLPYFAVKVINTLLMQKYDGYSATIKFHELGEAILAGAKDRDMNPGGLLAFENLTDDDVSKNRWTDVETIRALYGPKGWTISADYPDYTERWASYMKFTRKK